MLDWDFLYKYIVSELWLSRKTYEPTQISVSVCFRRVDSETGGSLSAGTLLYLKHLSVQFSWCSTHSIAVKMLGCKRGESDSNALPYKAIPDVYYKLWTTHFVERSSWDRPMLA